MFNRIVTAAFALSGALLAATASASAKSTVQSECGAEYQTAKAANQLEGKKWPQFLSECKTRRAAEASGTAPAGSPPPTTTAAAPTLPPIAPPTSAPAAPAAKPVSGGRAAMLERQRTCATEWKAQKVELVKATPGLKWPQFWSACNKRLKGVTT